MGERQGDLLEEKLEGLEREHAGAGDLLPGRAGTRHPGVLALLSDQRGP